MRERRLADQHVVGGLEPVVGSETEVGVFVLGSGVDPAPLVPSEWALLIVVGNDVLPKFRPDRFQRVPKVADDWEVTEDRVLALQQVVDGDRQKQSRKRPEGDEPRHD